MARGKKSIVISTFGSLGRRLRTIKRAINHKRSFVQMMFAETSLLCLVYLMPNGCQCLLITTSFLLALSTAMAVCKFLKVPSADAHAFWM